MRLGKPVSFEVTVWQLSVHRWHYRLPATVHDQEARRTFRQEHLLVRKAHQHGLFVQAAQGICNALSQEGQKSVPEGSDRGIRRSVTGGATHAPAILGKAQPLLSGSKGISLL